MDQGVGRGGRGAAQASRGRLQSVCPSRRQLRNTSQGAGCAGVRKAIQRDWINPFSKCELSAFHRYVDEEARADEG